MTNGWHSYGKVSSFSEGICSKNEQPFQPTYGFCCYLFLVGCLRGLLFGGRCSCIEDSFTVHLSLCCSDSLVANILLCVWHSRWALNGSMLLTLELPFWGSLTVTLWVVRLTHIYIMSVRFAYTLVTTHMQLRNRLWGSLTFSEHSFSYNLGLIAVLNGIIALSFTSCN